LAGGTREAGDGYYLTPTILENVDPQDSLSRTELFGPITILYKVKNYEEALQIANNCDYGLTASLHTSEMQKAFHFIREIQTGVVSINGPTHGSEPHMPFGGLKDSGNGTREAG